MKRRTTVLVLALAVSIVRVASAYETDDDNFRPDVFSCEAALATLTECCPGFNPTRVSCTYLKEGTTGCDFNTTVTVSPALDANESACVLATSCTSLRTSGVCSRAQTATDYVRTSRSNSIESPPAWRADSSHAPVCP